MKAFHPRSRCLLADDERCCAVAPKQKGRAIAHGKDPSVDFDKDDQGTHHMSWVKSPFGCQHCQLGIKHPFPATPEDLEAERAAEHATSSASADR